MRVLLDDGRKMYHSDIDKHNVPTVVLHIAHKVYAETSNGYFKCLKSRDLKFHPLSPKEAFVWILSSNYIRLEDIR
jgi:hypothetical protein